MLVLAHRGLSAHYPENTLLAFEKAIELGAKAIECDVHQVGDEFVVFHDYSLWRLCNTQGMLLEQNIHSLKALKIAGEHPVPSLEQVVELCAHKVLLNLELKSIQDPSAFANALCQYLQSFDEADVNITLSSFNHPLLTELKAQFRDTRLATRIRYGALIAHLPNDLAQYALMMDADIAAIDAHLVNEAFVQDAHKYNIKVWCYTVNDTALLQRLFAYGVDGIFSDDAPWAISQINKL
ncbi:glycerophosphodiester phosphodiesterase [Glaciecola siphonariae]|uniref:Glycerophosphodiester phosphodiesterase n=1 Tax=Glaciecola siphonariae TaxID=521012 RepID=A0ABV9LVN2_9ALTE